MILKSLELQGFKTFPDKTRLTFEDGISAVVGPNGSGKSNISDALRWVLGEQSAKSLRCVRMEDVIFSGTPQRKAQGFAEVTLTIDNQSRYLPYDGDTVAVTRRYYRSGDSEYLINKATVRLKDIHELFMDTGLGRDGYSIIGQGKIDSIISAKSEERREIFEEAAGISRYRYRKEEAERKLAKAEENLLRLQDILSELEGRVGPLKEQSEKAKTYLALYQEKRRLEIGLWLFTLQQSGQVLKDHEEKIAIARHQHDEVTAEAEALDRQIDELFQESNACLVKAEQARDEAAQAENDAVLKDGERSVLQNDIRHNTDASERLEEMLSHLREQTEADQAELEKTQAEIGEIESVISRQQAQYEKAEQQLREIRKNMDVSTGQLEIANDQLRRLADENADARLSATQASSTAEEITLRLTAIGESQKEKEEQKQELEAQITGQRQILEAKEQAEADARETLRSAETTLADSARESDRLKAERDKAYLDLQETQRRGKILEDLEKNLEGFLSSVKTVMRMAEKGELSGVHGPVSRLLTVPKEYAVAMETALGGAAQHIVVGSEQDAKNAIRLLKQRDGGRATFLPVSTIRGRSLNESGLEDCKGFIGVATDLCQCDDTYREILRSLLGRIAVVETLDDAVSLAKRYRYQFRVVTLDGQVVNSGGSMTGGSQIRKNGLLSRASDIAVLREKAEKLQALYQQKERAFRKHGETTRSLQERLQQMRAAVSEAARAHLEADGTLRHLESDLAAVQMQQNELGREESYTRQRRVDLETAREEAERRMEQLAGETLRVQAELGKISGGQADLQKRSEQLNDQMQETRLKILTSEKDREALLRAASELTEKLERTGETRQDTERQLTEAQQNHQRLEEAIEKAEQAAAALRETAKLRRADATQAQEKRLQLEKRSVELRAMEKERSATRETIGQELTRLEERKLNLQRRYDEIIEQLWSEYELTRREAEAEAEPVEDEASSAKRLRSLKSQIKALGSINVSAIEEYAEVSERFQFLTEQVEDVEQSRTQLYKLIRDLTKQMTEIFKERFAEINSYFGTTFRELFGGGKAHLELSDPEDVLNSGILILAQPPGKIVKNLELLSGGEKALVAISLYFSIMKVSPPPFCMLDEIEAALDDVNVVRFADYLRRMNKNTQFIVITHRRGTMEEADVLYGVTMQDEGISKLLKLDPGEVGRQMHLK